MKLRRAIVVILLVAGGIVAVVIWRSNRHPVAVAKFRWVNSDSSVMEKLIGDDAQGLGKMISQINGMTFGVVHPLLT